MQLNQLISIPALAFLATLAAAQTANLSPLQDNTIYDESGILSNGNGQNLFSGRTAGAFGPAQNRRALLQFDIAGSVPAGATITSVRLSMVCTNTITGAMNVDMHRLLTAWGEGASTAPQGTEGVGTTAVAPDATWTDSMLGTAWGTAGGDHVALSSDTQPIGFQGPYTFGSTAQLVADVQDMLDNPGNNFGWLLIGDEATPRSAKQWGSRENQNLADRPELVVAYTAGSLGTPFCFGVNCPCGNDDPTAGCVNSSFTNGALLDVFSGTTSVASDDLVLRGTNCPPLNSGLWVMGGVTFTPITPANSEGLICSGGLFRFIPSTVDAAGNFDLANIVAMAPAGQINGGDTRYFTAWTRDVLCGPPPTPCPTPCSQGSNLTNGLEILFTP